MSSSGGEPPNKRPKLNPRLTAPFKSPLRRTSPTKSTPTKSNVSSRTLPVTPSKLSSATSLDGETPDNPAPDDTHNTGLLTDSPHQAHHQIYLTSANSSHSQRPGPKPPPRPLKKAPQPHQTPSQTTHFKALKRRHTTLLTQRIQLKSQLDTAQQALRLKNSPRDEELVRLTRIWRDASRAAAEELFGVARDRVNGMGGMAGWKERERDKRERFGGWGDGDGKESGGRGGGEKDGEGEGLSDGEKERLRGEREEWAVGEGEEGERGKEVWEEAGDDEGFTMDMMLRSMNIDLDLIGYDKDGQRWVG
ncbi:MAG: hypothetical protein MMC23_003396 [Stictis urceolatum]|nr:hypothetical protein [Stictis urceolata]